MVSLLSAQNCLTSLSISPNVLDRDSKALGTAINFLGQHQLLGLKLDQEFGGAGFSNLEYACLLYTSPSPRDQRGSRMPSSA